MMGLNNIERITPMFMDMIICTQYLHCLPSDFYGASKRDRKMLRLFFEVSMVKNQKINDKDRLMSSQSNLSVIDKPKLNTRNGR